MKEAAFTTHPSTERQKKNLLLLNLIKSQRTISRTDLSRLSGINIVTVSNYVNSYLKKGLLIERGFDASSGGRRPELVELNRGWGCVAGIDIGEGYIKGALAGFNADILAIETIDGYDKKAPASFLAKIIDRLANSAKIEKAEIKKIGKSQGALSAAFGEKNLNPELIDAKSVLYIYKDTGSGVFMMGDEFYEATDVVSGSLYLRPWSEEFAIVNVAKGIVKKGIGTKIVEAAHGDAKNITLGAIIKAASDDDEVAVDLIKTTGVNLGVRIAYLINLFHPEHVVIGGGIEEAGSLFMDAAKESEDRFISQKLLDKVKIKGAVAGGDVSVKGAAFLAAREAFLEA